MTSSETPSSETTQPDRPTRSPGRAIADAWSSFWFTPQPAYTLGLVRIGFGVVAVVWALMLLPELFRVFGEHGAAPDYVPLDYQWSVFEIWSSDRALMIGWVLLLLSAIVMTVGWHTRVAAIVVFVLIQSFHRRAAYIFNAGDTIVVVVALVLALSCCGAALSLDQRRHGGSFWSAQTLAPWPIRLLQIQLTIIYLVSVQAKLVNKPWADGSAVFYAWRTDGRWALLETPEWLAGNAVLVNAATWGTLVIELAIAVLVWNRRLRFWVLAAGVVMHVTMMVTMNVGFFSLAMFVLYLAFVPWETVQRLPDRFKNRRRQEATTP
ncbi:MAG: hypothetical protein QOD39_1273 [Mycobacterium sp.]|jgi:hypothetical protein|nr:hypothetical protein [Mycobacterium sp.]